MNCTKIINDLLGLLASELEEKFDDLYERGEVDTYGVNYEDARSEWVDRYIVEYTCLTAEQLDALLHGEIL